jgi:putative tricarboxylic transport membrane protein
MNVAPGPLLITQRPEVFWGLVASMFIGNAILLLLNLPLVGLFVRVLTLPTWFLMPAVAATSLIAVYAVNTSAFDLLLVTGFGVLGWGLRKVQVPLAPIILGVVLGPLLEKNLRRAMALSGGDWGVLVSSPIAIVLYVVAAATLAVPILFGRLRPSRRA